MLYSLLFTGALIMAFLSQLIAPEVFARFLRGFSPLLALIIFGVLGYIILEYASKKLKTNFLMPVYGRGLLIAASFATIFGIIIIIIDTQSPFPADINISFPASIFFYPAIGFIAEIVFHLLPIAILCIISGMFDRLVGLKIRLPMILGITAIIEPIYQMRFLEVSDGLVALISIHILLLNVAQLWLLKNYGFFTMYVLRTFYYLIWHIIWGTLRLDILYVELIK